MESVCHRFITEKQAKYCLTDRYGEVWIHLLPFIRPSVVRHGLEGEEDSENIRTYQEAVQAAVAHMEIDPEKRNVLLVPSVCGGSHALRLGGDICGRDRSD
mgnify:CR=1 FL=1